MKGTILRALERYVFNNGDYDEISKCIGVEDFENVAIIIESELKKQQAKSLNDFIDAAIELQNEIEWYNMETLHSGKQYRYFKDEIHILKNRFFKT